MNGTFKKYGLNENVWKAREISLEVLKKAYHKGQGIYAGSRNFKDFWIRDFCFAAFGYISEEKVNSFFLDAVWDCLKLIFHFQKKDGQLPFLIGHPFHLLRIFPLLFYPFHLFCKLFGLTKAKPKYKRSWLLTFGFRSIPMDQNSLVVIIFEEYIQALIDLGKNRIAKEFAQKYYKNLKKAIDWNSKHLNHFGLIKEKGAATWTDTIIKNGIVFYTNALHYEALKRFTRIANFLGRDDEDFYKNKAQEVKQKLNQKFWLKDKNYFADWIESNGKIHDHFSSDNLLAIAFDIIDKKRGEKIENFFTSHNWLKNTIPWPVICSSRTRVPLRFGAKILGISDYQTKGSWLHLGAWDVIAKLKLGKVREAKEVLERIAQVIIKEDGVFEVYAKTKPLRSWAYKSESDFTWNAGMYVKALNELVRTINPE